jgi:hypothetical protein
MKQFVTGLVLAAVATATITPAQAVLIGNGYSGHQAFQ